MLKKDRFWNDSRGIMKLEIQAESGPDIFLNGSGPLPTPHF